MRLPCFCCSLRHVDTDSITAGLHNDIVDNYNAFVVRRRHKRDVVSIDKHQNVAELNPCTGIAGGASDGFSYICHVDEILWFEI